MYKINGHALTVGLDGTAPESHGVSTTAGTIEPTIGGAILIEPPSGFRRVFTWNYDKRTTRAVRLLLEYMDLESSPLVVIDTYVAQKLGEEPILLENLVVMAHTPELRTDSSREWVTPFSLTFEEVTAQ
jgi:hypothetical protein